MDVILHTELSGFAALADSWNGLLEESESTNIFSRHEYLLKWWKHFGWNSTPMLIEIRDGSETVGFAPFFDERPSDESGPPSPPALRMIGHFADYCGFVVRPGREREFVSHLLDAFSEMKAEFVLCDHFREDTMVFGLLLDECRWRKLRYSPIAVSRAPYILIDRPWDEYLKRLSRNTCRDLKKKLNRFSRVEGLAVEVVTCFDEYPDHVSRMLEMHLALWRARGIQSPYEVNRRRLFLRDVGRVMLEQGLLRLSCLRLNGEPVAYLWCYDFKGVRHYLNAAWNPDQASLSPGSLLLINSIRDAFDRGLTEFDMLGGEESFKYRYAQGRHPITSLIIRHPERPRRRLEPLARRPAAKPAEPRHNLLVIAHPDDEAIFFGGLLRHQLNRQWTCCLASTPFSSPATRTCRLDEFERSCALLDIEPLILKMDEPVPGHHLPVEELTASLAAAMEGRRFDTVYTHGIFGEYANRHHADVCLAVHRVFPEVLSLAGPLEPIERLTEPNLLGIPDKLGFFREVYFSQNAQEDLVSPSEAYVNLSQARVELLHRLLFGETRDGTAQQSEQDNAFDQETRRFLTGLLPALIEAYFSRLAVPSEIQRASTSTMIDVITPLQRLVLDLVSAVHSLGLPGPALASFMDTLSGSSSWIAPGAGDRWKELLASFPGRDEKELS